MDFIISVDDDSAAVDDLDRIEYVGRTNCDDGKPKLLKRVERLSSARAAPVTRTEPSGKAAPICASASASRDKMKGNADSGQIRTVSSVESGSGSSAERLK